jgi:16S rRNA (guanine1207-N2)-methyltransferase
VWLTDVDAAAVALTRANLELNGIRNATALVGDGYASVQDLRFDLIATNPPWHLGQSITVATAAAFLSRAPHYLAPGGRAFVVANSFLPYEAHLRTVFARVMRVADNGRFKVLRSEKPLATARGGKLRTGPGERASHHTR